MVDLALEDEAVELLDSYLDLLLAVLVDSAVSETVLVAEWAI